MEVSAETFWGAKKVHIIGIGGSGLSAVARMLHKRGARVTGSDQAASSTTEALGREGMTVHIGQDATHVPGDAELVIYTVAIPDTNPELVAARARSIPAITYPQSLSYISKAHTTIAVAGTHGKTTTTAMIGGMFMDAGLSPTIVVGSIMAKTGSNFVAGDGEYFVVEACEYKRSFLNLTPTITCITNIDEDHLDYYTGGLPDIQQAFIELLERSVPNAVCVTDVQHPNIVPVIEHIKQNRPDIRFVDYTSYIERISKMTLAVPGQHNKKNAAVALAVAALRGLDVSVAEKSLASFPGTARRFEYKGLTPSGALVYDDYGHHPTEIAATLEAATSHFAGRRIVAVFQPHLYSRTREHFEEFASVWKPINEVWFAPIYAAREALDPSVNHQQLAKRAEELGIRAHAAASFEDATHQLLETLQKDDVCLVVGAGDVTEIAAALVSKPSHAVS